MKARSALKEKQARAEQRVKQYEDTLGKPREREIVVTPERVAGDITYRYGDQSFVRTMRDFNRSLRTKDTGKIRLAVATHLFGKYPTPKHLQDAWTYVRPDRNSDYRHVTWRRTEAPPPAPVTTDVELERRQLWFITQATGGSLYKKWTKDFLSKKETHAFLTCPIRVTFEEAILWALASSHTSDNGLRGRIMKSKLIGKVPAILPQPSPNQMLKGVYSLGESSEFWRDVVRFFCVNPVSIQELNDFVDYLSAKRNADRAYSLKGRTIVSLKEQMQQWHRDLARVKRMGNHTWPGLDLPDFEFEQNDVHWQFKQIKTSKALADEGNRMHHCVYSYQQYCINGRTSIWSVLRKKKGNMERAVTIEVNNADRKIVQIRGYANRTALDNEMYAIKWWASKNNLSIGRYA
jgi:hypothetical protein